MVRNNFIEVSERLSQLLYLELQRPRVSMLNNRLLQEYIDCRGLTEGQGPRAWIATLSKAPSTAS